MSNIRFNKSLGQHILKNPGIIDTIIERANINRNDTLLEVGSGTGNLTLKLLPKCKKVVCYEVDKRLASELIKRAESSELSHKLRLNLKDVLKADIPHFDICISNIPYQISSPFIFKLLKHDFKCAYIMFQKEFADRLVARPGSKEYCRLSVAVQLLSKVQHVLSVGRNNFVPPPKVDSSIVKFVVRKPRPPIDLEEFDRFLKVCFLRKNKTLIAIFKGSVSDNLAEKNSSFKKEELLEKINSILRSAKEERARKMAVEDFLILLLEFKKAGISF